jgi:hypothetical protein
VKTKWSNLRQTWRNNRKRGRNILAESSKEGYCSKMAVLPTMMMNIEGGVVQ